jgi:hypothetical protein
MKKARLAMVGAMAVGGLFALSPQAHASSGCASGSNDPVSAAPFGDGGQVCVEAGSVFGATVTATLTPGYLVVDGDDNRNQEGTDGYVGVDGGGPVVCASGDYAPDGNNKSIPDGRCVPQAAGYGN